MENLISLLETHLSLYGTLYGSQNIINDFDLSKIDLTTYINFNANTYTRNLIIQSQNIEIYLICWNSHQESPLF